MLTRLFTILVLSLVHRSAPQPPTLPEHDRIRLAEAFQLAEKVAHPLWEGWDKIPFSVLMLTEEHEFLLRHPGPPDGFTSIGHDSLLGCEVHARSRILPMRLGSAIPLGGIYTAAMGPPGAIGTRSSTSWVLKVLHEHFHQLQLSDPTFVQAIGELEPAQVHESETWMVDYPFPYDRPSVAEAHRGMSTALYEVLMAPGTEASDEAFQSLLERLDDFRNSMTPADFVYFDLFLWHEGVPRYMEYILAEAAVSGYEPLEAFQALPDYLPYAQLATNHRKQIVDELPERDLTLERRSIVYPVGAAFALLLDQIEPSWKERYLRDRFSLTRYLPTPP